jgi:integrase
MRATHVPSHRRDELRAALPERWRLAWDFGVATGWRISDILQLRADDITGGGQVRGTAQKTSKALCAVIPSDLEKRLLRAAGQFWVFPSPTGGGTFPVTRQAAHKAIRKAARQIGLKSISPHSARKTFAVKMWEQGHTLPEVQAALQHTKPETTFLAYLWDYLQSSKWDNIRD